MFDILVDDPSVLHKTAMENPAILDVFSFGTNWNSNALILWTSENYNNITLQGTNISPKNGSLKMIFLFPRWDMLIPWRVMPAQKKKHWLK